MIRHRITIPITPAASEHWATQARCAGRDVNRFYGDAQDATPAEQVEAAIYFCEGCPVKNNCLDDAEERGERHGVWGGKDFTIRGTLESKLARLHAIGKNDGEIAEELGISIHRARRMRHKAGLPPLVLFGKWSAS